MITLKKRLASLLLAFAVAVSMMSGMTLSAFAEGGEALPADEHIQVVLNAGTDAEQEVGYLDLAWLQENTGDAQVFPFATKKNNGKIQYKVVKGVPVEEVLEHLGLDEEVLDGAEIRFCDSETAAAQPNNFGLPYDQLLDAKYVMQGAWDAENNVDARTYIEKDGEKVTVTPVIATQISGGYPTYDAAVEAMADTTAEGFWTADKTSCFIGNTSPDFPGHAYTGLDSKGQIADPAVDCNGKNAINNFKRVNIVTAADAAVVAIDGDESITLERGAEQEIDYEVAPMSATVLNPVDITSSDESVVAIDGTLMKCVANGTATVTVSCGTASASVEVTVVTPADEHIQVVMNAGTEAEKEIGYLDLAWLQENTGDAQVFPFATKKNNGKIQYKVVKGVPVEAVLEHLGLTEAELDGAEIRFCDSETAAAQPNNFGLPYAQLLDAKYVMQGAWDAENNVDARTYIEKDGEKVTVTPVIATQISGGYPTYDAAVEAMADTTAEGFWTADKTSCFIGNTSPDFPGHEYGGLDAKDQIVNPAVDCNGKNAINNFKRVNIVTAAAPEAIAIDGTGSITLKSTTPVAVKYEVAPMSATILNPIAITTSNAKIVKIVDGKLVATGIGTAKVTVACGEVSDEITVTVPSSVFKPAKPTYFKATNIKTRRAKLSWHKVTKATGYEIYRSTKKSSGYKKVKTTTKNTTVVYKSGKLKKGKKYYFKIRAYKTVNGKKVYSSYTSAKAVKIKK